MGHLYMCLRMPAWYPGWGWTIASINPSFNKGQRVLFVHRRSVVVHKKQNRKTIQSWFLPVLVFARWKASFTFNRGGKNGVARCQTSPSVCIHWWLRATVPLAVARSPISFSQKRMRLSLYFGGKPLSRVFNRATNSLLGNQVIV